MSLITDQTPGTQPEPDECPGGTVSDWTIEPSSSVHESEDVDGAGIQELEPGHAEPPTLCGSAGGIGVEMVSSGASG